MLKNLEWGGGYGYNTFAFQVTGRIICEILYERILKTRQSKEMIFRIITSILISIERDENLNFDREKRWCLIITPGALWNR